MTLSERMAIESKDAPSVPRHDVDRTGRIREKVVLFGSASTLVGIVTDPPIDATDATRPGVILLNAGLLHRIGPNRLHVELARRLAAMGLVVLRFDFSGIGDSDVREDDLPFWESAILETQEAMAFLEKSRGLRRFVLMGLCSGAVSSFRTARVDSRVAGAVLLDPWGYSAESSSLATTRLYWQSVWSVLRSPGRWMDSIPRHLDVRVILRHLRRTLERRKPDGTVEAEFRAVLERGVQLLVLFSSPYDRARHEFDLVVGDRLKQWTESGRATFEVFRDATHTFRSLAHQSALVDVIDRWTQRFR